MPKSWQRSFWCHTSIANLTMEQFFFFKTIKTFFTISIYHKSSFFILINVAVGLLLLLLLLLFLLALNLSLFLVRNIAKNRKYIKLRVIYTKMVLYSLQSSQRYSMRNLLSFSCQFFCYIK